MTTVYYLDQGHPKEIADMMRATLRDVEEGAPALLSPGAVEPPSHLAGTLANWLVGVLGFEPEEA